MIGAALLAERMNHRLGGFNVYDRPELAC
jgi:hypothetical protein